MQNSSGSILIRSKTAATALKFEKTVIRRRSQHRKYIKSQQYCLSSWYFPRSKPAKALLYIAQNHEMVLCDRNIAELRDILNRKAPKYLPDAEVLPAEMSYERFPQLTMRKS